MAVKKISSKGRAVRSKKYAEEAEPEFEPTREETDFELNEPVIPQKTSFREKAFPFLIVLLMVMSFAVGSLWTKTRYLEANAKAAAKNAAASATVGTTAAQPTEIPVSMDEIKSVFDKAVVKFGDTNSKLVIVEVADPSCPFCHVAAGKNPSLNTQINPRFKLVSDGGTYVAPVPEIKKLIDQRKAAFAYIYTPGHGNGEMGTKALYCANESGKFWEVHDLLMSDKGYDLLNNTVKNDKTKSGELVQFLAGVINSNQLKSCIDSGKYDSKLTEETKLASDIRVEGTPAFFLNTTKYGGAFSWDDMKDVADAAMK